MSSRSTAWLTFAALLGTPMVLTLGGIAIYRHVNSPVVHTRPRAQRIALVLDRSKWVPVEALLGRATIDAPTHRVEALVATDDADGHAQRLVLRITEIDEGDEWSGVRRWTACWEYHFAPWGVDGDPRPIPCPDPT